MVNTELVNMIDSYVREFIVVEAKVREADTSDGSRVPFGSKRHIADLESRITDMIRWRDKQKRGSEARANYARIIFRLKNELRAAKKSSITSDEEG